MLGRRLPGSRVRFDAPGMNYHAYDVSSFPSSVYDEFTISWWSQSAFHSTYYGICSPHLVLFYESCRTLQACLVMQSSCSCLHARTLLVAAHDFSVCICRNTCTQHGRYAVVGKYRSDKTNQPCWSLLHRETGFKLYTSKGGKSHVFFEAQLRADPFFVGIKGPGRDWQNEFRHYALTFSVKTRSIGLYIDGRYVSMHASMHVSRTHATAHVHVQ